MSDFIGWLRKNMMQIITICILFYVLFEINILKDKVDEAKNEASFTNSKLDYVESEINEQTVELDTQRHQSSK